MDKKIIDTNIIIRYLMQDNLEQYKIARDFFDLVKLGRTRAFLEQTVFTETIFVLASIYKVPKTSISDALYDLLIYKGIYNEEKEVLLESLNLYVQTNLHIVDCIIAAKAKLKNLEIQTFDVELKKYSQKKLVTQN